MALGFFRRRQKLVLIVMVLLMVAFLIPSMFQGLGRGGSSKEVIGRIGDKEITMLTRRAAGADLDLLNTSLKLGRFTRPRRGEGAFVAFLEVNAGKDSALTWALLLDEAREMGITVNEDQIDVFFAESGLTDELYQQEVSNLRQSKYGYTEKHLRRAVANYLTVMTAFETAIVKTPASLPELRHTFADMEERIQLAMVAFEADDYTADIPDPLVEQIVPWFNKYKTFIPRHPSNKTEFGFGYRRPNRVDVAYLFIDRDNVSRAVEPSKEQMELYWRRQGGRMKIKVPIPATGTVPSDSRAGKKPTGNTATSSTGPAEPPAESTAEPPAVSTAEPKFREYVTEKFTEARPYIRQIPKLMNDAFEKRMNVIISRARQAVGSFTDADDAYAAAAAEMIRPADALLQSRKVSALPFKKAALKAVIEELEILSKVKIVYPFGRHDKFSLDEQVVVRIEPWENDITLGEALERIRKDNKKMDLPPIKWVTCAGFDDVNVIFPSEPVNLVPVSAGRTGMVSFNEIRRHEVLGWTGLSEESGEASQSVLSIAAGAEVFQSSVRKKHESLIKRGDDFDRAMYVFGRRGRLLWRLVDARVANVPLKLNDEIRKEVVRDIKIFSGFKKARAAAETMKVKVDKKGGTLKEIAEAGKHKVIETKSFSRKTMDRAGRMYWSYLPEVGQSREFIDTVFRLVPDDPDGPHKDRPTVVAPLYRGHKVMLVQRIGYEPASAMIFEGVGAYYTGKILSNQRLSRTVYVWFNGKNVAARVGYVPEFK